MLHLSQQAHQGFLNRSLRSITTKQSHRQRLLGGHWITRHNGRVLQTSVPSVPCQAFFTVTETRPAVTATQWQQKNLSNLENARDQNHLVDTTSLKQTLNNHQRENAEKIVIKRIYSNPDPRSVSSTPTDTDGTLSVRRLNLHRSRKAVRGKDYNGVSQSCSIYWRMRSNLPRQMSCPWLAHVIPTADDRNASLNRLGEEISAASMYFRPTKSEAAAVRQAVSDLTQLILDLPKMQVNSTITDVNLIGSRASGFAHATSDIDLNIVTDRPEEEDALQLAYVRELLRSIYKYWKYMPEAHEHREFAKPTECIAHARVPILVGIHTKLGLEFQLQSASTGYGSLGFMKLAQAEYPTVVPLFHVIKQMLAMRDLCDGARGGITSYPVFNMILASLKLHETPIDLANIGQQLIDFLEFWSTIDTYKVGITHIPSPHLLARMSSPPGGPIKGKNLYAHPDFTASVTQDPVGATPVKFSPTHALGDFYNGDNDFHLVLHDPANPHNNLGRAVHRIKDIQATMYTALTDLQARLTKWDESQRDHQSQNTKLPILNPLIQGDYTNYTLDRKRLIQSLSH